MDFRKPAKVELTVLLPCLNEVKTLAACIEKIHLVCQSLGISYEIIISDNGSTDGSQQLAADKGAKVVHAVAKGYGAALKKGFESAQGDYVLFADADNTYDLTEIPLFWQQVQKGYSVVIGTRLQGTIHPGAMPLLHRYLGTPVLSSLIRFLYSIPITDCNSGMRLLKKEVYQQLRMSATGMEFASEMLVKLGLLQIPIQEVPITLWPDQRGRRPHLRTWRDGWRHLRFILMYAPVQLLVLPGFSLYCLGLVGVLGLITGPLHWGRVYLDYHTQIGLATLGLVGFIMWSFGHLILFFSHVAAFKQSSFLSNYLKSSFEIKLLLGLFPILIGLVLGGMVLVHWIKNGFYGLSEVHRFVASLFFIVSGFASMLLALTLFTFEYERPLKLKD